MTADKIAKIRHDVLDRSITRSSKQFSITRAGNNGLKITGAIDRHGKSAIVDPWTIGMAEECPDHHQVPGTTKIQLAASTIGVNIRFFLRNIRVVKTIS